MGIGNVIDSKLNEKEIISVFCNPTDHYSVVVGFIAAADEECFVLKHITSEGKYDGYFLRRKDQVFRTDEKTHYEINLQKLYTYYNETHLDFEASTDVLTSFLTFAQNHKFVVGLGIKDFEIASIRGFVDDINACEKIAVIHQIDDNGAFDGYSTVDFDSNVRASCDCEKEASLRILNSLL